MAKIDILGKKSFFTIFIILINIITMGQGLQRSPAYPDTIKMVQRA